VLVILPLRSRFVLVILPLRSRFLLVCGIPGEGAPKSIEVVMMEVPCCRGLHEIAKEAIMRSVADIALERKVISVKGNILNYHSDYIGFDSREEKL
jgi:hypothetical protein